MRHLTVSRVVDAPLDKTWEVVADVAGYAQYAPNILSSSIVAGEGVGMVRECSAKEGRWQEVCTHWRAYDSYAFQVQTQADDYPYPFSLLNGRWAVVKVGDDKSKIVLDFEVEFKNKLLGWLIFPALKLKYLRICEELLDNWQVQCSRPRPL